MSLPVSTPAQELSAYHDRSIAMLRRYFRMSLEIGRMPSVLGREVFRARVTSYRVHTFEDAVIFVHDVEKCLEQLDPFPANSSLASSCRTTATKKRRGWSGAARGPSIACFLWHWTGSVRSSCARNCCLSPAVKRQKRVDPAQAADGAANIVYEKWQVHPSPVGI